MKQSPHIRELVAIFEEAKGLVSRKENNFAWSSWEDASEGQRELDRIIGALGRGELLPRVELEAIFVVSGPMQELGLNSGWSPELLQLAARFEDAAEKAYPHSGTQLPES
jgi:hypothetical protein